MSEILNQWASSIINDAPYLFGAVVFIFALWAKFNACIDELKRQNKRFLDYILEDRIRH